MTVPQPLSASRSAKLRQMIAEVWLAEGLDALTLARRSPLSPKTNRVLRHRPSSCRLLTRAFVPTGPQPRGPPCSLLIVWIRCTRGRCLSLKRNLLLLSISVSVSSHLVQQIYFFLCPGECVCFWIAVCEVVNFKWSFYMLFSIMLSGSLMLT